MLESSVLVCDFHREQAWERWFSAHKNGATKIKDDMMCKLRRIARARTHKELSDSIESLRTCDHYKNASFVKMVNWLEKQWLPIVEVCTVIILIYT